jgi:hypothetical protein
MRRQASDAGRDTPRVDGPQKVTGTQFAHLIAAGRCQYHLAVWQSPDRQRHTKYHEQMLKCPKVATALRRPRQSIHQNRQNPFAALVLWHERRTQAMLKSKEDSKSGKYEASVN